MSHIGLYPSLSAVYCTVYSTASGPLYWYLPTTRYPALLREPDSDLETPLEVEYLE